MYSFWKFFVTHNRFSFLVMVVLAIFGLYATIVIPKESNPEVVVPIGIVTTVLPGAAADDIESLITNKLEQRLSSNLENLDSLTSVSREGVSSIVAEFEADADLDTAIQDLKDEVDTVVPELPDAAEDPFVSEVNFVDQPIVTIAVSGNLSDAEFSLLADELEDELEGIQSVSRVEKRGARDREVTIIVDEAALIRYNLTLGEVIGGLRSSNTTFPIGSIVTDGVVYNIAFEGDIDATETIPDIPIATRGGQPVYVRDIAVVEDGYREAVTLTRLSVDGAPTQNAITLDVFKRRGGDITRISDAVVMRIAELQEPGGLLEGLTAEPLLNSGREIKKELTRLTRSGLTTILLVVFLLIFAIGWREGLVAGAAIPLSFTIGFIGLYLSGNTINFVSLFALILAVGILVDSAIVMVEGINHRMKQNPNIDKTQAALETIKEFNIPLMAGTLTTVAMFSGLFLVGGVSGQFISSIPFTINFILFASLLVALGFIPLIASLFLKRRQQTRLEVLQYRYSQHLENWYRIRLAHFLKNRKKKIIFVSVLLTGLVVAILLPILGIVKVIFFEQSDIDWIYTDIEMPQGTDIAVTDITARRVEEVLYQDPAIESFVTTVGASSQFSSNSGSSAGDKRANMFITLREDRAVTSTQVVERLRTAVKDINEGVLTVGQPSDGPPTGAPIVVRFLGDDLDELSRIALDAAHYLRTIPGTTNVETSTNDNSTEFVLTIDTAKAITLGLDPLSITQTLRTAVYGIDATSITTPSEDIDVVVKLALNDAYVSAGDTNETTIDSLKNLRIALPNGETVILGSLAEVTLRESSTVINHEDKKRVISLTGDVTADGNAREINTLFLSTVRSEVNIPDTIRISAGGESEESQQAFQDMFVSLIVGVLLMLTILVLQFNSFRHTFYVLSILPFSLIGILAGLAITGLPLSFPSLMGFIALSGIVVNNSILLIDQMNSQRKTYPTKAISDIVVDASVSRLRPILLTTLTTVIGIYPLTYASDLWAPLAWAVMFGLSFSVIITLLLVPIIYNRKPGKIS